MPKTLRNAFEKALTYENLMKAHLKCQRGKTARANVIKFNLKKEEYISWLYDSIKSKSYEHSGYTTFYVTEPKLRQIQASSYKDRIVHRWCVDNFLDKTFTPCFIENSYACIKGKGMHKAALDVQKGMKECKKKYGEYYILKMDVAKYFPSIDRQILMEIIKRKIKDKDVLWILEKIIYYKGMGKGLPIGNLTSQILANVYLNEVDQYIKHNLRIRYYYRYMDDSVILLKDKKDLKNVKENIEKFLDEKLKLKFNSKTNIFKSKQGVNFCGYMINEYRMKLRNKGKKRLKHKVKDLKLQIKKGEISSIQAKRYLCGYFGYMKYANVYNLRQKIFKNET